MQGIFIQLTLKSINKIIVKNSGTQSSTPEAPLFSQRMPVLQSYKIFKPKENFGIEFFSKDFREFFLQAIYFVVL